MRRAFCLVVLSLWSICPPVLAQTTASLDTSESSRALSLQLKEAILSHPVEAVRVDLDQWIQGGDLLLSFGDVPSVYGDADFCFTMETIGEGAGLVPVLSISPSVFASENARELLTLGLWHEYIHMRQSLRDSVGFELFVPREWELNDQEVIRNFELEAEAYWHECQLALDLGFTGIPMCDSLQVSEAAFRRTIARMLTESPKMAPYRELLLRHASESPRALSVNRQQ